MLALLKNLFTGTDRAVENFRNEQQRRSRRGREEQYRAIRRMMEQAREQQQEVQRDTADLREHVRRSMNLEEFLNTDTDNMATMREVHRPRRGYAAPEEPFDPQDLNLEDLVNGNATNMSINNIMRAMALEIMTLRDEIGTLEERLNTVEYYDNDEAA